MNEIKKELGDLMLHMVFYSKIGSEKGAFDVGDVLNSVCDKLIHRHPHIYGDVEATTEEEVKANWEAIKLKEKGTKSVLQGVPRGLPALVKAIRIGDKARGAGFDWEQPQDVWVKIREELVEFEDAQKSGNQDLIEGELGDVLFSIVNFARLSNLDPEMALERTNKKFIYRFTYMENAALAQWVKRQRYQYKLKSEGKRSTLSDERVRLLNKIGFIWNSHDVVWEERLFELSMYKRNHGNCIVPSNYERNPQLAVWVKV